MSHHPVLQCALVVVVVLFQFTTVEGKDYDTSVLQNLKNLTHAETRSYNGVGNNINFPDRGARETPYTRTDSGVEEPAGYRGATVADWVTTLENNNVHARLVSNDVNQQPSKSGPTCKEGSCKNTLFTCFGQMVVLDMTHSLSNKSAEIWNIPVPSGDSQFDKAGTGSQTMTFKRSKFVLDDRTGIRKQINSNTHFLDGEAIYGYDEAYAKELRTMKEGLLKTSSWGGIADYSDMAKSTLTSKSGSGMANACPGRSGNSQLYMSGSRRVNLIPQLVVLHTLFVREHNRRAKMILKHHPTWTDEEVYQLARKWVIGLIQSIFYDEYLLQLLGNKLENYEKYDTTVDPSVDIFAGTVAMRYGHSEIPSVYGTGSPVLRDSWFQPKEYVHNNDSFVAMLTAMMESKQEEIDPYIVDDIRHYTVSCDGQPSVDLAARNIQRGRDNGVPNYQAARATYGLKKYTSIDEITTNPELRLKLKTTYGNDINTIDPWVGALSEDHISPSNLGPLLTQALTKQFTRTRNGDRFWYENTMTKEEIKEVKSYRLKDVIGNNAKETLRSCKSSPWLDTSHESCDGDDSKKNIIEVSQSPYVAVSWEVINSTPGSEKLKFTFMFDVNSGKQGYMGMSIGSSDGGMTTADMIIVAFKDEASSSASSSAAVEDRITVHDYYSTDYIIPVEDTANNLVVLSKKYENNRVTVEFERLGTTGDLEQDAVLSKSDSSNVAFAWDNDGSSKEEATIPYYHKTKRKAMGKVNFFSGQTDDNDTLKVVHGMIMSTIWMFNITLGVITARYRAASRSWFGTHVALQAMGTMLTFPMYFLAHFQFVLKSGSSWHSIIGNIIVWSCSIQALMGVHMALLFEYRVQKQLEKLEKDPSCVAKLKWQWFDYLGTKINQPTCRTHCCCCLCSFCFCCAKKTAKETEPKDTKDDKTNVLYQNSSFAHVVSPRGNDDVPAKKKKVLKVRREIYLHYAHKFYGKTLLLLAYIQVGLGLHAYGAFDEYIEEGKIPTGGKMILLILFLIWYALVFTIFMYKEIMYRCGFASFSIFDFLDYLLDELIDCVSNRCCCCCSNKNKNFKDSKDLQDSTNNTLPRVASTVSVLSPSSNNACYTFAKVIQRDALYKELPVAKMYRLHLNDFLTEICGIPNSTVALIKHAGVGSIAEIAFLVPEKDLLKYTKLGVKKIRVMIRRARRIVGYVNGVNIAKADNERTKALVRQQSFNSNALVRQQGFSFMEDTKQFLDARELNEVADGPVRWQRSPAKAKPNHQKERMNKRESPVSSEMKRVTDETKKTKESKNYDGENKKENNASRPSGTKDIQTHSSLSETVATRKEEQRDTRNNSTITTMTEPEDEEMMAQQDSPQLDNKAMIMEPEEIISSKIRTMTEPEFDDYMSEHTDSDVELSDYSDADDSISAAASQRMSRHFETERFWEDFDDGEESGSVKTRCSASNDFFVSKKNQLDSNDETATDSIEV